MLRQYAVPFFIWTNYDIQEEQDVVISPNYLGVLTARLAGLPMPAVTPVGFVTGDGQYLARSELNEEQRRLLDVYETLNYCGMVDLFDEARPMFCMD